MTEPSTAASPRTLFPGATFWIVAVILTMPIREIALGTVGDASIRIGDVILALAMVGWVGYGLLRGRLTVQGNGLDQAILLFLLLCAWSITWAVRPDYLWLRIIKLTRNVCLYALLVNYLKPDFTNRYRTIALAFVVAGLMESLAFMYSMEQNGGIGALRTMFTSETLLSNDSRLTVVKHENGAGVFMQGAASWLPLCLLFGMGVAPLMKTLRSARMVHAAAALMCILTFLTMSRTAWLALGTGAAIAFFAAPPRDPGKLAWIILGAGTIVLAVGWLPALINTVANRMPHTATEVMHDPSLTVRWTFFRLAWRRFQLSPLIGGGIVGIDRHELIVVHNTYLQVLGELGALGVITFGLMLWRWVAGLFRAWRSAIAARDNARRTLVAAMIAMAVFFLTYFMAGHDLEGAEPWIAMAMGSAVFADRHRVPPT